jgi:lipoate-protein ligase A
MTKPFRIIDTGVRAGRANIAFDAALIEERQADRVPDTIRFLRFPPTALIGRHQDLSREIDLDYCKSNSIGTVRRITGGGAIYLDEGQLGWELVFHRSSLGVAALPDLAREICNAAAKGFQELGVDAKFRPRNDIEVDGRKISGTGGFFDGDVLIYQGTVLVDMNAQQMVSALNVPQSNSASRPSGGRSPKTKRCSRIVISSRKSAPTSLLQKLIIPGTTMKCLPARIRARVARSIRS